MAPRRNICNLTSMEITQKNCKDCNHSLKNQEYCQMLRRMNWRWAKKWRNLPHHIYK
ncbi:MAG: hypothetical protein JSW01_04800 [Candidatus Bathyarchaeota archaeon]|nr:MAG: hypothetical protein JSW01_04800 [Candidatus Bathyarchaeota archaeon]